MIERRSGKIIVLSGRALAASGRVSPPCRIQGGAGPVVETVAEEVRDHNIQINSWALAAPIRT